jgi:hypothetical protein
MNSKSVAAASVASLDRSIIDDMVAYGAATEACRKWMKSLPADGLPLKNRRAHVPAKASPLRKSLVASCLRAVPLRHDAAL